MSLRNSNTTYGSVAKFFHWLISTLIILMLIFGYFMGDFPKDMQSVVYNLHKLTGLTILTLMVLRLGWTLANTKPALPAETLPWQRSVERGVQFLLYTFAIVMPLAGWVGSAAAGRAPHIGGWSLMLPIQENKALSMTAFELHGTTAVILIVLISVHVLAALYHHVIKKDGILRRMLPS